MPKLALAIAGAGLAVAVAALTLAPAANAATTLPPGSIEVVYSASGTSHIAKPDSDVTLGPAKLDSILAADASFTAKLPLPPTSSSFKVIGFIPVTSTVSFVPVGDATGKLTPGNPTTISTTATYYLKLTNVKLAGIDTGVGNSCQTSEPVTIPLSTPAGGSFDVTKGGTITGSYTIGNFANCGLTTGIINALVPGPNNTVSITLKNGKVQA